MMRSGVLGVVVGVLLIGGAVGVALAKQGVVKTRNGQSYEGDITEKGDLVIVNNRGIETRINKSNIESVTFPEDFDKQFGQRLAKLEKNDARGRIALAREAFENGRYRLARDVLEEALTIDPNNADAAQFRETVMAQIRLERAKQNAPATVAADDRPAATRPATTMAAEQDHRLLKPRDINAIRREELTRDERNVPIRFENDVNRRYAKQFSNEQPGVFLALPALQQAMRILADVDNGTAPKEMREDIKVMRDPAAMLEYRRAIQPYVLQNCATSHCHGGPNAKVFQLITPAESDPATYTNFYILQSLNKKAAGGGGVFAKGQLYVIDRMQPTRSLLLDYSIPRQFAEYDHPEVPNFKPPLRGPDDPRHRVMLDWISNSLNPAPNYGIEFRSPRISSTQPATTQATTEPATAPAAGTARDR